MGNKNLIITIEREYGSGGRIVGRKLAEELGLHFYDDEILKMASEKSAVGEEFFRLADEKAGNNLLHRLTGAKKADVFGKPSLKGDVTSPDNLFKFQAMVMRELAEQEPCVFVGRAAGYVLDQDEEIENLIRIFVYANLHAVFLFASLSAHHFLTHLSFRPEFFFRCDRSHRSRRADGYSCDIHFPYRSHFQCILYTRPPDHSESSP